MKECSERATSPRLANYELQGVFREVEIFSFLLTSTSLKHQGLSTVEANQP